MVVRGYLHWQIKTSSDKTVTSKGIIRYGSVVRIHPAAQLEIKNAAVAQWFRAVKKKNTVFTVLLFFSEKLR